MKVPTIKLGKKTVAKGVVTVMILGFSAYGISQAWIAGVKKFNHEAAEYVLRNDLLTPEQAATVVKTEYVIRETDKEEFKKQVDDAIKANLR